MVKLGTNPICFLLFDHVFQNTGVDIVRRALRMPALTIAKNAGIDGSVVVAKVEEQKGDFGYDAMKNEYVNLIERGIIDPTKVKD